MVSTHFDHCIQNVFFQTVNGGHMRHRATASDVDPDEKLNWADYIDALLHQDTRRSVLVIQPIKGRRLRDAYRDQVEVTRIVHPLDGQI